MKQLVLLGLLCGGSAWFLLERRSVPEFVASSNTAPSAPRASQMRATAPGERARAPQVLAARTELQDSNSPQAEGTVHLLPTDVLATVNGKAIHASDLGGIGGDEIALPMEIYKSRLNRAIEVELTFQAAKARSIELTPAQQERLRGIYDRFTDQNRQLSDAGFSWSSVTQAQLHFEERITAGLMLQENLVSRETKAAPAIDPGQQGRFEVARADLLKKLKANASVEVTVR